MLRKSFITTAIVAACAMPAIAQTGGAPGVPSGGSSTNSAPAPTPGGSSPSQVPSAAGSGAARDTTGQRSAASVSADMFAKRAAQSNAFEIQSSQLALRKAQTQAIKDFAQRMITDHERADAEFKAVMARSNAADSLTTGSIDQLDAPHRQMIADLDRASGAEFERLYIEMQTRAHNEAVELFSLYSRTGDDPQMKAFATKTLPVLQQHLEQVKRLTTRT